MNEIQELEQLLSDLLKGIQDVLISGERLSDEFQGQLAITLQNLTSRIDFLRAQDVNEPPAPEQIEAEEQQAVGGEQPPVAPPTDQIPLAPHESSNIRAFAYDPDTEELLVKFQDKYPRTNGPIYMYQGVPEYIFDIFSKGAVAPKTSGRNAWHEWKQGVTPSHGAAMYALIKQGGYPYQRIR